MDEAVMDLFARYERFFDGAMAGESDMGEVRALYASAFVAATPAGVMAGQNDGAFAGMIEQGFGHHRAIGTRATRVRGIRTVPIDERHCMAHVDWTASYARGRKRRSTSPSPISSRSSMGAPRSSAGCPETSRPC